MTTWPEMEWADVQSDLAAVIEPNNKQSKALIDDVHEPECDERVQKLATSIFSVHEGITRAIKRIACDSALVRVIQTYLMDDNIGDTKLEAMQWLEMNHTEWMKDEKSIDRALVERVCKEIHQATTKEEFLEHFQAAMEESISFPLEKHVKDENSILGHVPLITSNEAYQDAKDIQRDQIQVNGNVFPGIVGYDNLIYALTDIIQQVSTNYLCTANGTHEQHEAMAKRVLHTINRTQSGGASYEVLGHLMPLIALLRPNSKDAEPLGVTIDIGPYEQTSKEWCVGLRVLVETTTQYIVCDAEDPTDEWCQVLVSYRNRLCFSFGGSPYTKESQGARMDNGRVYLRLIS
ncbi:hypothetical protein THRCLA_11867 [Thraustotheca clavata]|uniref:Uncharacterized protein n=1 Tax=Thraustotheca clavata TaxID=74557 RepID=A0A1V9Y667_9STRA|nr:hypothetical protein THRCLA_11867 [Thraustotheca clavata]